MSHRIVKRIYRFSAWILIQALLVSPSSAWALRAQTSEGAAKSGLEERLMAPTLVAQISKKGVQIARRSVGVPVGSGVWSPKAGSPAEELVLSSNPSADISQSIDHLLKPGTALLHDMVSVPVVRDVFEGLSAGREKMPVVFLSNSGSMLNWRVTDREGQVGVDVTVPAELYQPDYAGGLAVLGGLLLHHAAARAAGYSPRRAYHATIAFYESLSNDQQKQLDKLLDTPWMDHGNTFRTFLHRATDSKEAGTDLEPFRGVESQVLEEQAKTESKPDVRARMLEAVHYRDRQVSWLMGQIRIDLPYDRAKFVAAARNADLTLDQRREGTAAIMANYDRDVEVENARRVAADVRESLPDGYPLPLLVAGRFSRAFGNQANLFADSSYVPRTEPVVQAISALDKAVQAEELLKQLEGHPLQSSLRTQMVRVHPAVARLRLLAFGPDPAAPMTQYRGAARQVREALTVVRTRVNASLQRWRQIELDAAREGIGRRADARDVDQIEAKAAEFQSAFARLAGEGGEIDRAMTQLEGALAQAQTVSAAFSVLMQRPSPTGSINLAEVNELEPKPEQEPALQKLVRLGGHNTYGSPDLAWVGEATDVIEAAPLSIYERLVEVDGRHITVFEVDQEGLEQTIRSMADHWARNIDQSMDSEHAALARRYVVEADPSLAEQARRYRESGATEEGANLRVIREAGDVVQQRTAQVAAWAAREFDRKIEAVEARVESRWKEKDFIDRMEALRQILPPPADVLKAARRAGKSLAAETQRLTPAVLLPRRERPAFHMLTTEAPGLVEGFIQVVLEEEMALRNVLLGEGKKKGVDYEAEVKERTDGYRVRITALAEQVVKEFGYGVMVENLQRQGLSRDRALQKVIGDNITLRDELVAIAVLAEAQEAEQKARKKKYTFDAAHPDHPLVDTILGSEQRRVLQKQAEEQVMENNRFDPVVMNKTGTVSETIEGAAHLSQERDQRIRSLARREALARLSRQHPDWRLEQRARSWYRQHTALAQTNARREVIAAHHLQARMMDPRHYYGSGATYQRADGKFVASGRRKRYDLIYAPSRVNLGKGERESVEVYPQWVGVTDPLSARRAYRVYSLINENVQVRLIKEAETLKVSENERTALIRAVANTQSFFTQSLQYGDAEDLWYQFDLRGGLPVVAVKQGESFQPGPTTGYCIPKDPLFKLFRHALTDEVKLTQIGIPAHLQPVLIQMVAEMEERRSDFDSEGEFEQWVMQELLSQQGLRRRFKPAEADAVLASLNPYLSVTGGILLFHLTKLHEILGNLGRPSLLASQGHDLGLFLWSAWAGEKVTLGGEQVNRATLHQITSDVFHLRDEAEKLNPRAAVVPENQMRVHAYGPYKGDPDHPSPPDVRDSAGGRLFMDLAEMGEYVSHSLDAKGQAIWRANRYGLRLDSDEPDDLRVAQLLAQEFLGLTDADVRQSPWYEQAWGRLRAEQLRPQEFSNREGELLLRGYVELLRGLRTNSDPRIAALQEQFPGHGTVGDITITVVPGVSTGDFMGFKVDAKTAMEETADDVQAQLTALGISVDQMRANAQLRRPLDKWVPLTDLPAEQRQAAVAEIGGRVHPLALRLRGPGTDFQQDLQGQDVVVFLTVHPDLLELNPAQIRDLMLVGRPNSALGIRDGSVQGRHRVWFDRDVMFWYAAGRGVDQEGRIITDWSRRDAEGRNSVYATFGVGGQSWKPLLGTDLREEAIRQERRAVRLYSALQKVADAADGDLRAAVQAANEVYRKDLSQRQMALEAQWAADYLQMTQGKGVDKPRDEVVRSRLQQLAEGLPLDQFTSLHWLSIGGMFLLNGAPDEQQKQVLETLTRAQQRMSGLEESIPADVRLLIVPQMKPAAMQAGERRGQMFSVKASEEQAVRAVARLAALQAEAVRQGVLAQREKGFRAAAEQADTDPLAAGRQRLQELTEAVQSGADSDALHEKAGQVIGRSVQALRALNDELLSGDARQHDRVEAQIRGLTNGRELDPRAIKKFTGTYEDPGIFALWFERAGDSGREKVASAVELFTAALALEKVAPFLGQPAEQVNEGQFWRATAEFFAETIDDHFHEYNPWAYDPKRGSGFSGFYDDLGVLRPERAEELYGLAWRHNRQLYAFLRELMITRTSLNRMPQADRDRLLGRVILGAASEQDEVTVEAIGAGAAAPEELKWRAYNQLREMAFLRNDGFQWPVVFEDFDPNDPETLDAAHRVNFTFMAPVGRTHYSRALMEASALGENVFITRNGRMVTLPGANGPVLQIQNAHFWLSEPQYRQALIQSKGMDAVAADRQIAEDRKSGRLTPKGIRVAAGFRDPVTVGSVVAFHHHPLVPQLEAAGYPYTDKDGVHYDITYDKSLYPQAFNPPHQTGVLLPAEIDWHHEESVRLGSREAAVPAIRDWLRPFAQQYGTLVAKGSAESGARNFQRFDLLDSKGQVDEDRLTAAAEFIYEVSKGQNVTVQRMVLTTPIAWMDPAAVQEFVNRQVRDWGVAVNLETHPKSWVYGTVRVILSSGMPDSREPTDSGLFNPANWHVAHRISLNSLQAATNVGRQGTLEKLTPEMVRPEFREQFIPELEDAGRRVMVALARYGKKYWDEVYVPQYQREHGGQAPVEFDASGVPYWWPRYMMLDIIPEPVWGHEGREVADARVIDVIPGDPARGTPSRFILRTPDGQEFDGEILGFRFWLLEPNVGIGLWPNYSRRELVHEQARAKQEGRTDLDWSRVGEGDRVVLNDYIAAGEALLRARFDSGYFGPEGPHRRPATVQTGPDLPAPAAPGSESADPFLQALTAVRGIGVGSIGSAETSLVLVEAGLRALGGRDALAGQDPAAVLQQANEWLDPVQTASRFPQGTGISVSGEQVAQWLGDSDYRARVSELILDRVLSHPLAPPVAVVPGRMNAAEVRALLPESSTFAVVTGKRVLMTHHVYPWSVSQPGSGFNVVGVHADWLSSRGQAKRFLVLDAQNGYFREVTPEEPVALTHALITELPIVGRDGESQLHRKLEGQLGNAGVVTVNPYGTVLFMADNKSKLRQSNWMTEGDLPRPKTLLPDMEISPRLPEAAVERLAGKSPDGVVIQPIEYGTEGRDVAWFASDDLAGQMRHIEALEAQNQLVMASSFRGNVFYNGRVVVFRFNVVSGRVVSVSAVAAPPGEKIASLGRGGETIPLAQVLNNLQGLDGGPVRITSDNWERLEQLALQAAKRSELEVVGLDLLLERGGRGPDDVSGLVLEANGRPGTLIFGEQADFPDDGSVQARPAGAAHPDFWRRLSLRGHGGASVRQVVLVHSDPAIRAHAVELLRSRHPWLNVMAFATPGEALSYFSGIVDAGKGLPYSPRSFPNLVVLGGHQDGLGGAPARRLQGLLSEHHVHYTTHWGWDDEWLLKEISYARDIQETFTLSEWRSMLDNPEGSGLREMIARFVPADRLDEELNRIRRLVEEAMTRQVNTAGASEPLFLPEDRVALSFAPGRVRFFMGHSDIRGSGGQTINAATHLGTWALTQVREQGTGRVVADNLDPAYPPFEFHLDDPNALPPLGISKIRPDWLAWAEANGDPSKWGSLTRGVFAFIRTEAMDPGSTRAEADPMRESRRKAMNGMDVRILVSESNLPTGLGMASSSALPALLIRGFQMFLPWEWRLNDQQLNDMDYVAYVAGDRAGTADMTAINTGQLGQVSVLYSYPERQGSAISLPKDFRFLVVDLGGKRLDDPSQPPDQKNLAAHIKSMTGMGPSLASVWLRHVARTEPSLRFVEGLLMAEPTGHPFGLLRELTDIGELAKPQYDAQVNGAGGGSRWDFAHRLLDRIPNDLTLGQLRAELADPDLQARLDDLTAGFTPLGAHKIPAGSDPKGEQLAALRMGSVIPLRQMASYIIWEIRRGVAYERAETAKEIIHLMRRAQDGDRAAWTLGADGSLMLTPWGETHPDEAFFRSLPEVDAAIDDVQRLIDAKHGEDSIALRVMAAGLGSGVAVGVTQEAYADAMDLLKQRGYRVLEIQPGGGATSISMRAPAAAANTGLEEVFIPRMTVPQIQQWVGSLDQSSEVSQELYGWIRDIPAEEQKEVLRVASAAYLSFGDLMRWTSQYVVENRYKGRERQKQDDSWVTEQDEYVQKVSNERVRDLARQLDVPIAGIGEEGDVKTSGARWHLIRDPIDGTNAYRKQRTEKGSGHYLSTLTLLYTDLSGRIHPVLTMVIAPEYPYPPGSRFSSVRGLWMTAGLGIDGVWLNGEPIAPVQESVSLKNAVAAVRVSRHRSATVDEVYREILKAQAKRVADYDNDMALFEFPLSVAEPGRYPQLYLVDHPNLIWDALPPRHLAVALGVQVTALNRNSLQLTSRLLQRQGRTVPPQVFGLPGAQQQFIRLYQQRRATAGGLEEMPPSPVKSWVLHPTGIPGYQRLLYTLEDGSPWLGGVVKDDVPSDAIAQTATVAPYSTVEGKSARLGNNAQVTAGSAVIGSAVSANAQILGSVAEKALIHPWAQVSDSTLGPAFDTDSWSYSTRTEGDPELSVRNHSVSSAGGTYQVELGVRTFTNGSVVQDSFVGDNSRVLGSAVVISRWGPNTLLDGGVKSLLTVAARGHANVAGVQHRPDGSEVPAALEVAEAAFMGLPEDQHSGTQIHERNVGYTEAVVANSIPLASYDGNELKVESYAVPPLTLNGDYSIFSIFAGSPSPQSVKTDGRPTPGVITRLTGGPGEQISQHGRIVVDPFAMVPAFSNVIGRLLGFPELNDPAGLLREPEVTHLGALSTVGVDAQLGLRGLEAWGRLFPGEARGQLGRASGIAPWVFLYAPEAVFTLMGRLAEALPAAEQSRYDDLPQRLLRSGQALSRWMLDQEKAKGSEANAQVVARLNRYVAGYTALIESNAWTGGWVQEGSLRHPAHWHRLHGRWESEFLDLDQAHHVVHPLADSVPYAQVSMNQLLALPPGIERPDWNRWTPYYLKDEDLRTDPPTPLVQLQPVSADIKAWRIIGQDDHFYYTVEGGRIGREVNLKMVHPSAVVGPGTVLTGAATSVGEGSRLLRVVADQSVIGKEVQLTAVRSVSTTIGDKVKLTWAKLGPRVTIGSGTVGAYVGVADDSIIGENNTFEPFALVIGSTTSAGNVIGVSLVHSRILPGFMGRHLSTAVHHLDQQPVQFTVGGKRYDLGAASLNVAGGLFIQGVENRSVRLSAAYPLSLTTLRVGTQEVAEVGAFSVLKNQMALDGKVLPLTFHAFNILSSSDPRFAVPGRHNDAIGGALDFPGIFLRNFIYRTKKGIRDDLAAQGLTAEQIMVHPRMLQADYMIEATIIQALREAMEQLDSVDREAAQALSPGVEALREAIERDLAQIEMPDQSSLGARGAGDRQEIHRLITRIQDALDPFLESSRPDGVAPSGHTADQLLEGVRRLTLNLDGRWRMRDHTFTEVEWRYVDRENGKALDTWKPVPLAGAAAGLEEVPPEANPLSTVYTPERFAIASPAGSLQGAVYSLNEVNPAQLLADVQAGRHPTLLPKTERVGMALWENVDHQELLQELYGTIYDIRDYAPDFPPARVSRVIELLHHEDQGVAAAARDVIVNARIFGLTEVVRLLAQAYQDRAGSPGPYAAFYFHDAMTTRVDPVHKAEYGSPERNIFAGEMTPERMRRIHKQVKLWVDPKNRLSLFTGSGQRMVAPIATANAGFKVRKDGLPTGFADPDLVGNDIGSQPHDAVLVVFALVAKLFAENMPKWRQEEGLPMPARWTVAIGSDGRSTTGAITQVAARIFERMGVKVKMIGITSAPEAAARAYFSDPEENLLATFEITPSHINQAFIGTKLMLWMGQILPWTKAEEFNKLVQAAAQDEAKVQEVIRMLQDPEPRNNEELNHRIAEDMLQLPAEYQDSRRRYYEYLKRSWTGNWLGDPASLERDWQALKQSLRERGIVGVLDLNGGARVTDLPLLDDLFDGRYIVMAPDAGSYHHSLPPSRTAARPMMDFLARMTPAFEKAGLTLLAVMPDPDGDRKMMTYRDPVTGEFRYLDPQAGYLLDSMALVMAARELGIPGIGIVSNSAGNPAIRFVLGDRLGAEVRFADVGEANVVQAIANLIGELAQKHGVDLGVDPVLPPQARALEIRKRLASKVSVGGGEPPAAAFIQGVMVRDMAQAFGTMFWFYRKPEWVKGLIEALVDDPERKADLLRQAEEISRHPAQQQYLMHLLVEQVLPPMWSADPGDKTEKISAVRPEDQRYFKNVMDQMLVQDGVWVARIREEMARIISEEIGQPVSAEQITVSEPVNFNEAFEKQGRGDEARTLPDGRFDPSGGYAVNLSYRSSEGTNYLVGTLWVRGSKTDIGVTRDLPMMTAPFLRPDQAPSFQGRFRDAFHPLWTLFNYAAEAEELRGHVEGRFGGLDLPMLSDLTGNLESTLEAMRLVRNINYSRYGNPEAKDYSEVDAGNLGETDAAAQGAAAALQYLSAAISDLLRRGAIPEIDKLLEADFGLTPIGELPSVAREAVAYREAQRQVVEALRWKVQRFLGTPEGEKRLSTVLDDLQAFAVGGAAYANLVLDKIVLVKEAEFAQTGLEEKAGNGDDTVDWKPEGVPDQATVDSMLRDWLAEQGNPPTIPERTYRAFVRSHAFSEGEARTAMLLLGYGFSLPANATVRRVEGTWVKMLDSGLEEAPFEVQVPEKVNELLVVLTPETAEAGIRILNAVRITGSRGVKVAAIVWDQAQARRVSELLTENTRVNLVDIYNLKERGIDLPEALRQIRGGPFEGINRLFVVHTPMDFRALGAELEIPGISVRGWELWLERQLSSNV